MGLLMAMSITYFNFLNWPQLSISVLTVLWAILSGVVFCRLSGELCRDALLGANLMTQVMFLMTYLAVYHLLAE